jgi:hypothetical protein
MDARANPVPTPHEWPPLGAACSDRYDEIRFGALVGWSEDGRAIVTRDRRQPEHWRKNRRGQVTAELGTLSGNADPCVFVIDCSRLVVEFLPDAPAGQPARQSARTRGQGKGD